MALLGTVGEETGIGANAGSGASTPAENNPVTPGGQVNTPSTTTPAAGGSPQVRDPGTVGSGSSDTSGDLTVPPLGSLTPANTPVATYGATVSSAGTNESAAKATPTDIGLLSQASTAPDANISNISNGQMNPNDSTNAASQLDTITSQNSPYIQLAEQQGLLSAASRGLENSSLAAGSAQAAATAAAAPLAEQNAAGATQAALQTQQLGTQTSEFNSSQDTAAKELAAQLGTSVSQSNAQLETSNNEFNAQQQQSAAAANAAATNSMAAQTAALTEDMNKQDLSGTQAQRLADIQAQSNQLIASSQSASSMYGAYLNSMSATMANQNISPARAADTINAMQSMLQSGLSVIDQMNGMSLDLTAPAVSSDTSNFYVKPGAATNATTGNTGVGGGAAGQIPK